MQTIESERIGTIKLVLQQYLGLASDLLPILEVGGEAVKNGVEKISDGITVC